MNYFNSIVEKFGLKDFSLSELPVYSTVFSKRKIKKIQNFSPEKLDSLINKQEKINKFFGIILWIFLTSVLFLIVIAILKEWIKIEIPIEYNIIFTIVGFLFAVFGISYFFNEKALKKNQIYSILKSTKNPPDYIWQHNETESQPITIAVITKDKHLYISSLKDENLSNNLDDTSNNVGIYNIEDISSWSLNAKIAYHKESYSSTSAGAKSFHDIYMMAIGFFLEEDPYSVINPELRMYLEEISLELDFIDGKKYIFNVFSYHANREYALRGYEDFEIWQKRFKKMQNLIKLGILFNKECSHKGFFNERRIV